MKCDFCEFHCELSRGGGICNRYIEEHGQVVEREPFLWVAPDLIPIETLPFFHALPNSLALRLGTMSCNARCDYCINSHLAIEDDAARQLASISADELVDQAVLMDARAIVFAMNEVTVFLPSAIAVAEAAHSSGLRVGCLTNGFCSESSARLLASRMDFINVSLKSIRKAFYRRHLGLPKVEPVLRNIRTFAESSHVEIVTPLANEVTIDELREMADFIGSVDRRIPWHLMRLFAAHKRGNPETYDFDASIRFLKEIRKELHYVYFGSFPGSDWVDTLCPDCGERMIRRISIGACRMQFASSRMEGDCCSACGAQIPLVL